MTPPLIGFGFWRSIYEPLLPDPAWFVDETWCADTRQQVLGYLKQGQPLMAWMGYSWCRFQCGINDAQMGAYDLTDGTTCWPEGLAHYIETHYLRLPDEIVQHVLANADFPYDKAARTPEQSPIDNTWWLSQKGWSAFASTSPFPDIEAARNYLRRHDQGQLGFDDVPDAVMQAREQMVETLRKQLAKS